MYVGVGRSPTGIISFLSQLANVETLSVPLTRSRDAANLIGLGPHPYYSESAERETEKHLETFLGAFLTRENPKKLLLIDFVVNGSFKYALRIFSHFLSKKYPQIKMDHVGFGADKSLIGQEAWLPPEKFITTKNYPWEFERLQRVSFYDNLSEYGTWSPLIISDYKPPPKNTLKHLQFLNALRQFMITDSSLLYPLKESLMLPIICSKLLGLE